MASQILLVDDDAQFCKAVKPALEGNDYLVTVAADAEQAWQYFQDRDFSLVLLDLMLPDVDGLDLCQRFREHSYVPILVTSARQDQGDRMAALEVGADGYLAKPFETRELLARVAACLRRVRQYSAVPSLTEELQIGVVRLDISGRAVQAEGQSVKLTPKEFDLLHALMGKAGQVYRSEDLLWDVWGYDSGIRTRTLDVHIGRLRSKIEADPSHPQCIINVPGVGYMFAEGHLSQGAA